MAGTDRETLRQAYELIKAGHKDAALDILAPIVRADRHNTDAWWLLAHAESAPEGVRAALGNVLRLRPEHPQARQKLDKLNREFPPKRAPQDTFSFSDADDGYVPFDPGDEADDDLWPAKKKRGHPDDRPRTVVVTRSSGETNPIVIILAIIGGLSLLICGACAVLPMLGVGMMVPAIEQMMANITPLPGIGGSIEDTLVGDLTLKGSIAFGESREDYVRSAFDNHGYSFNGEAGQFIIIDAAATDGAFDTELALFDPGGIMIAQNDDRALFEITDSRIEIALPATGTYTIVVSGFASEGSYRLTVR